MRMFYTPVCLVTLYIFLDTGFIFDKHIKPTPYTIGTKYSPKLATTTIFLKSVSIFLQIFLRYKDKPSLTSSRSTIKSRFIHLLLVLLLSGHVELNPVPITPSQFQLLVPTICVVYVRKRWMTVTMCSCVINVNYGFILIAWCFLFQIIQLY